VLLGKWEVASWLVVQYDGLKEVLSMLDSMCSLQNKDSASTNFCFVFSKVFSQSMA